MIIDGNIIKEHVKNQCKNYQEQLIGKEITIIRFNPPANLISSENLSERQKSLKGKYEAALVSENQKLATFESFGVKVNRETLSPEDTTVEQFQNILQNINDNKNVKVAIVQFPIPSEFEDSLEILSPEKDIDIVREEPNNLFSAPATSEGVARIVESFAQPDSNVAVIGGGGFIGNGVVNYLREKNINCFILEDGDDLTRTRAADIVVTVTGVPGLATPYILHEHRLTDCNFEWVVVNDSGNPETREIVSNLKTDFSVKYLEIQHSSTGVGLCHARNAGLETATGELISYLDDDNSLAPKFIATTKEFFRQHPTVKYCMTVQQRRRDVTKDGKIIRKGKTFLSPSHAECSLAELISQKEIFDSNGFTHYYKNAPKWNPNYKVFADYEYLLQCTNVWGRQGFKINFTPLVNYIQSSEGIIGSSSYQEWAEELSKLIENRNFLLLPNEVEKLHQLVRIYQEKSDSKLPAFVIIGSL